jgi:histidyl-tRNA synthetase
MEKINSLKGMSDILPPQVRVWQYIEGTARRFFEGRGYKEVRTPILEETALFARSIGEGTDIVNKEMYTFTDRGGRSVTLRPEGTAPIVRSYIENNLGSNGFIKVYYIGPMFRAERPQKGRQRQFHQIGVEAIGPSNPYIDSGLIFMMAKFFEQVGLKGFEIKLCSLGCVSDKKKFSDALRKYLSPEKARLCDDCKVRLEKNVLRTLDCKVESCKILLKNSPKAKDFLCSGCKEHYERVKSLLTDYTPVSFKEDANMVRGLDYYTGTVFEVAHPALGAQDAIAAGGRYDNLIESFGGKKTSAIGFAIGVERLIMALPQDKKKEVEKDRELELYVVTTGQASYDRAYKEIEKLRDKDIFCEINYDPEKSLKSQMDRANKTGAKFVAIFGDEELKKDEIVLRNMKTSEQQNVKITDLAKAVKNV